MKIKLGDKYYLNKSILFGTSKVNKDVNQVLKCVVIRKVSKGKYFVEVKHYKPKDCNKVVICITKKLLKQGIKVITN